MALLEGFVRLLEGRGESLRRPERVRQRASAEDVPQQGHSLRLGEMIKTIGISLIIALPRQSSRSSRSSRLSASKEEHRGRGSGWWNVSISRLQQRSGQTSLAGKSTQTQRRSSNTRVLR